MAGLKDFKVKQGGAWVAPKNLRVKEGSKWETARNIWVKVNGVWRSKFMLLYESYDDIAGRFGLPLSQQPVISTIQDEIHTIKSDNIPHTNGIATEINSISFLYKYDADDGNTDVTFTFNCGQGGDATGLVSELNAQTLAIGVGNSFSSGFPQVEFLAEDVVKKEYKETTNTVEVSFRYDSSDAQKLKSFLDGLITSSDPDGLFIALGEY